MEMICLKNIIKEYKNGINNTKVLQEVSFKADKGEMIAIMGPSGSGKTTLLNILGLLDKPNSGEYYIKGKETSKFNKKEVAMLRNKHIGFIFQQFELISEYSIFENIELPILYANHFNGYRNRIKKKARMEIIKNALSEVGLEDCMHQKPSNLSGGQQQRVAIARALINQPEIILADEPTGALDQKTGKEIMEMLLKINKKGTVIIIITHDPNVASYCKRILHVVDGRLTEENEN
jgi:putative ABC transport system ATP-binding protein